MSRLRPKMRRQLLEDSPYSADTFSVSALETEFDGQFHLTDTVVERRQPEAVRLVLTTKCIVLEAEVVGVGVGWRPPPPPDPLQRAAQTRHLIEVGDFQ